MNRLSLASIGARSLKGHSFDVELAPATFFIGPNFSGKTARADAIRLLLIGFLPELGKTNAATFGLASGSDLEVFGILKDTFGNTHTMRRRWYLKGDSVKTDFDVPPAFAEGDLVEVMLNAESWFGLTERERVEWVYRNARVETAIDADAVRLAADRAIGAAIEAGEIELPKAEDGYTGPTLVDKFFADLRRKISEKEEEQQGPFGIADHVAACVSTADELGKEARAFFVKADKGVQMLAGLRAADVAPVDLKAIEGRIKELQMELGTLRTDRAELNARVSTARERKNRRETLKRELATKETLESNRRDFLGKVEAIKAKIAALPTVTQADVDELSKEESDAANYRNQVGRDLSGTVSSIARVTAKRAEIDSKTSCPYCGAVGEGWKALKFAEIDSALAGLKAKRDELDRDHAAAKDRAQATLERRFAKQRALGELAGLGNDLRTAEGNVHKVDLAIASLSGKVSELEAIPADDPTLEGALATLDAKIADTNGSALKWDRERSAATGRQNDLKRLAEAEKGRDEAKVEEKIAKTAAEAFREIKAKMVANAFEPLLVVANTFAGPLIPTPLSFNSEKSEIGTWRAGLWVGHKTFSGVERLLAYAAIQAAFAAASPVRVMVLDEMLRAAGPVFDKLVAACKRAVETGLIENFVGIVPGDPGDYERLVAGPVSDKMDCNIIPVL